MTEEMWKLKKELAQTKMGFAQSQMIMMQMEHAKAKAESDALGDAWTDPDAPIEGEVVSNVE
jgi:hypothetical protein